MIQPDKAVREFMKDVGKTLRPMGFRGSGNFWVTVTDHGRVSIHRSTRNNWYDGAPGGDSSGFFLSQQSVPEAWWRYRNWQRQRQDLRPLGLDHGEIDGPFLLDFHGMPDEPVSPTRHWAIRADPSGEAVAADLDFVREHLTWAVTTLARRGMELIEPARYLKELLNQPQKGDGDWEPIVVFLAEYGPSSALDEAIDELRRAYGTEYAEQIVEYARSR